MTPKKLALIIGAVFAFLICACIAKAQPAPRNVSIRASWVAPEGIQPDGYILYWGPKGGQLTNELRVTSTTAIAHGVPMLEVTEFRVVATLGTLMGPTSDPAYYIPLGKPTGLIIGPAN